MIPKYLLVLELESWDLYQHHVLLQRVSAVAVDTKKISIVIALSQTLTAV
jgi:hypothetical protein